MRIYILLICLLVGTMFVYGVYQYTDSINHQPGTFKRYIDPHTFRNYHSLDLKYNSYYLAGMNKLSFYLGNSTIPLFLTTCSYTLDTVQNNVIAHFAKPDSIKSTRWIIRDSVAHLMQPEKGSIDEFTLPNLLFEQQTQLLAPFNGYLPAYSGRNYFRVIDDSLQQLVWIEKGTNGSVCKFVPAKQNDGFFSVDGMMRYNGQTRELVYAYFYKNLITILDSNLKVLHNFHTIDTNTIAKVNVASIASQNITTIGSEVQTVNKRIAVNGDSLFVWSGIQAKNEEREYFKNNAVVDVYLISKGRYIKSFYIPNLFHSKVKNFDIDSHHIVVLYEHHCVVFDR